MFRAVVQRILLLFHFCVRSCFICSILLTFCLFISSVTEWRKMVGTYNSNYRRLPWFFLFNKCTCVRGCSGPCSLDPSILMENCAFSAHVPCPGVSMPDIYVEIPDLMHACLHGIVFCLSTFLCVF